MPLPQRRFVIRNRDLHPEVAEKVGLLLEARGKRVGTTFDLDSSLPMPVALAGAGGMFVWVFAGEKGIAPAAATGALLGGLVGYKVGSPVVRKAANEVQRAALKAGHLHKEGVFDVHEVNKTHLGFVDRKGNLVLVPKTRIQKALLLAQKTFLKHVVPGRMRLEF